MGSGGLIVMDENSCMVDVSKYFLNFLIDESCGKCIPCREGISEMLSILDKISKGSGTMEDLDFIDDISLLLKEGSLCALGNSAMNPVQTAIKYFKHEFIEHITEKKCSAKVCKSLFYFDIDPEKCIGCQVCAKNCPVTAITGEKSKTHVIDQNKCTKCGICLEVCPKKVQAVDKYSPVKV